LFSLKLPTLFQFPLAVTEKLLAETSKVEPVSDIQIAINGNVTP
jgi:hypothetical protein